MVMQQAVNLYYVSSTLTLTAYYLYDLLHLYRVV